MAKSKQEIEIGTETVTKQDEIKSKYTKEDLLVIFDAIMFEGEYREDITIKGRLKVTFKTRSAASTASISKDIDSKQFHLMSTMHEYRALLSIAHSITGYNDKDLSSSSLETRIAFLEKLPTVVVSALSNALVEFDIKTEAALMEQDSF
jgi:hypothetical protein